jgi:16S rRNA (cytidine1402-2'-O)-methyltransferase
VSDPGDYLIRKCVEAKIAVVPIPGPSSVTCALSVSGLDTSEFSFPGFLARKGKKRVEQIERIGGEGRTTVILESPKRVVRTLVDILNIVGDREAAVCREMTKLNEEVIRGPVSEIISVLEMRGEVKGEIVIVVSGGGGGVKSLSRDDIITEVRRYIEENPGKKTREAAKVLAARLGVSARDIYEMVLKERGKQV